MKVGDIVVHKLDLSRDVPCAGLILDAPFWAAGPRQVYVLWMSESQPRGWHYVSKLEIISEAK